MPSKSEYLTARYLAERCRRDAYRVLWNEYKDSENDPRSGTDVVKALREIVDNEQYNDVYCLQNLSLSKAENAKALYDCDDFGPRV